MHDAVEVRVGEPLGLRHGDLNRLVDGKLFLTNYPRSERFPFHEGQYIVQQPGRFTRIVNRYDMRLLRRAAIPISRRNRSAPIA